MPSIDAPAYYDRSKGLMSEHADPFFKWMGPNGTVIDETGETDSPLGFVALLHVTQDDLDEYDQMTDTAMVEPGWYITRQDDNGLIWAMTYGGDSQFCEEAARADFAEAEKVSSAWDEANDGIY